MIIREYSMHSFSLCRALYFGVRASLVAAAKHDQIKISTQYKLRQTIYYSINCISLRESGIRIKFEMGRQSECKCANDAAQ